MDRTIQRAFLRKTNILSYGQPPWGFVANEKLKRWDFPIPIKLNNCSIAIQAVRAIEKKLGKIIFDVKSIENLDDKEIERGVIISVGTAVGDPSQPKENWKGNVSGEPNSTSYPVGALKDTGEISGRLYVNLGSDYAQADVDVAVHELGHAIGMGAHFVGFGCDDYCIGENFFVILKLICSHDIGVGIEEVKFI